MNVKRIALAIAFSPRLNANVAEASRLQKLFSARLYLIHVGSTEDDPGEKTRLGPVLAAYGLNEQNTTVLWKEGDTVETILDSCREHDIDLLVTGALEKEGLLTYLKGSIARQLGRKACCSVLLLTAPSVDTHPFRRIVVSGTENPQTSETIDIALQLARLDKAEQVDIIQESDYHNIAQLGSEDKNGSEAETIKEDLIRRDREKLEQILACTDCGNLHITTHHLEGKPGYTISNYAREQQADLLVVSSPEKKLNLFDRMFQHDMEYVLADLPCNLLIVKNEQLN